MYADLGPHVLPAAVTPPTIDSNVWYTSLLHDESQSKQNALTSAGNAIIWIISVVTVLKTLVDQLPHYYCPKQMPIPVQVPIPKFL